MSSQGGYKDAEIRSDIGEGEACTSKAIEAAKMKSQGMFFKSGPDLSSSDSEFEEESSESNSKLLQAMEEIKRLKKQLQKSTGIVVSTALQAWILIEGLRTRVA